MKMKTYNVKRNVALNSDINNTISDSYSKKHTNNRKQKANPSILTTVEKDAYSFIPSSLTSGEMALIRSVVDPMNRLLKLTTEELRAKTGNSLGAFSYEKRNIFHSVIWDAAFGIAKACTNYSFAQGRNTSKVTQKLRSAMEIYNPASLEAPLNYNRNIAEWLFEFYDSLDVDVVKENYDVIEQSLIKRINNIHTLVRQESVESLNKFTVGDKAQRKLFAENLSRAQQALETWMSFGEALMDSIPKHAPFTRAA